MSFVIEKKKFHVMLCYICDAYTLNLDAFYNIILKFDPLNLQNILELISCKRRCTISKIIKIIIVWA